VLLVGKVALIAGSATEIGRATAMAMSGAGAKVAIGDRLIDDWEQTIAAIEADGSAVLFHPTDVTIAKDVKHLVQKVASAFGSVDVAFNNTCIDGTDAPLADQDELDVACTIDTNLNGLWLCLKYEIQQMLTGGGGAIVNNSSIFGFIGYPGGAIYAGTKHAVTGMTKATALDYAHRGIRVNAVAPSPIELPHTQQRLVTPMGRAVKAGEVASAVIWLCSDRASFITGHTLPIDGGFTAQ
jgi:NAD(P)-dependent dehydrogenase (short-subunit alcohol dehydrogenase family)